MTGWRSWVLVFSLCASCGSPEASESEDRAEPDIVATSPRSVPYAKEGVDYKVERGFSYRKSPDGLSGSLFGLIDRNTGYTSVAPRDQDDAPDAIGLVDLRTKRHTILAPARSENPPSFIDSAARSGREIVWIESPGTTMDSMLWELYSINLDTRRPIRLASYRNLGIERPPWFRIGPQIVGPYVYLVAIARLTDKGPVPAVYRVRRDGTGRLHKVFDDAGQVFGDGDDVRFERGGQILRWNPVTRTVSRAGVEKIAKPCGGIFRHGVAVQCDGRTIVVTQVGGSRTVIVPPRGGTGSSKRMYST
jgi:hypothetical protein